MCGGANSALMELDPTIIEEILRHNQMSLVVAVFQSANFPICQFANFFSNFFPPVCGGSWGKRASPIGIYPIRQHCSSPDVLQHNNINNMNTRVEYNPPQRSINKQNKHTGTDTNPLIRKFRNFPLLV